MHIHHGYIGAFLVAWSILVVGFKFLMIGDFTLWLAWGGLGFGVALLVHDTLYHLNNREKWWGHANN